MQSEEDGKATGWKAFYEGGKWAISDGKRSKKKVAKKKASKKKSKKKTKKKVA